VTFWSIRGHLAEGRRRVEAALAADERPTLPRAEALHASAILAALMGDPSAERRHLEEALALFTTLGDDRGSARTRYFLATTRAEERAWETMRELTERSVAELEAVGEDHWALAARRTLAWAHEQLGDLERFRELTEEYLERARSLGNKRVEARALGALGTLALEEGRTEEALELITGSFRIDRELGFSIFIAIDLVRFAAIFLEKDQPAVAARLLARADLLREEVGFALESWAVQERDQALAAAKAALDESEFAQAWEEGRRLSLDEAVALAVGESVDERDEP
jgi:tetratricopeptide (TPR) repeat protein